jgi:DNA repair exonuclease SbcCD ATPase subunit
MEAEMEKESQKMREDQIKREMEHHQKLQEASDSKASEQHRASKLESEVKRLQSDLAKLQQRQEAEASMRTSSESELGKRLRELLQDKERLVKELEDAKSKMDASSKEFQVRRVAYTSKGCLGHECKSPEEYR